MAAIPEATARILAREGFAAVNTNRVAAVAGVSVGSLYQYFPNKEALVGAVAVDYLESVAAMVAAGLRDSARDDLATLVRKLIRAIVRAHAANPRLRRAIIEELPRIGRPARMAALKSEILGSVTALLAARRRQLKVRDLPMAAFMIVHTIEHLTYLGQGASGGGRGEARLERELTRLVLGYLTAASVKAPR